MKVEFISNFSFKSKIVFIIIGFIHNHIMEKLENDYIIFKTIKSLNNINSEQMSHIQNHLNNSKSYFITINNNEFMKAFKHYKNDFKELFKRINIVDLEVLKAIELIGIDELSNNDYPIGIELPDNHSFKDYIDDVAKEERYKPHGLYEYLKIVLENEIKRQEIYNQGFN